MPASGRLSGVVPARPTFSRDEPGGQAARRMCRIAGKKRVAPQADTRDARAQAGSGSIVAVMEPCERASSRSAPKAWI